MRTSAPLTPTTEREDELVSELRASLIFVIGTMVLLMLVSIVGLALT